MMTGAREPSGRPYADPYLAGIGIGFVLLAAFVIMGRGLGASGAMSSAVTATVAAVAPEHARSRAYYATYLPEDGSNPLADWLVFELVGVAIGAALSAWLAGRARLGIEHGPRIGKRQRIALAIGGGATMGIGAKLAHGCTSGQALTGGAMLSVGSWLFIAAAFAAAYALAPALRRVWT